jgi:hypothetical protein
MWATFHFKKINIFSFHNIFGVCDIFIDIIFSLNITKKIKLSTMKKEIRVTKEQFERLIEQVHTKKYGKTLKEGQFSQGSVSNPGVGSAEGIAEIVRMMKKAWSTITDPKTKEAIKNFIAQTSTSQPGGGTQGMSPTREGKTTQKPTLENSRLVRRPAQPKK